MGQRRNPTVRRRRLGIELRRLREAAGLNGRDAGAKLGRSEATISRMETGKSGIRPDDVRSLLDLYGVTDEATREALVRVARDARKRGWWHGYGDVLPVWFEPYLGLEAEAASLRAYEIQFVPGLLQTRDYAEALFLATQPAASPDDIERQVELRMRRQQVLTRRFPRPPHLWVILSEAVLRLRVGDDDVLRDQYRHLLDASVMPNVTLQVLPFGTDAFAKAVTGFRILGLPEQSDPEVVYLEHLTGGLLLEEPEEIERYTLAFDHLRAEAHGVVQSTRLIAEAMAARDDPRAV